MRFLLLLILPLLFTACGPEVVFEGKTDIPSSEWMYADTASFAFNLDNVDRNYDLYLDVEHGDDFGYQNFYIKLHTTFPSGKRQSEQISLQLAGDFGQWLGSCSGGVCKLSIPILKNAKFDVAGQYQLTVEQYSRDEPLMALKSMGLAVVVSEE
jgi:gliding motility-associated lipoprotein GldH